MQRNTCLSGASYHLPKWKTYSTPPKRVVCYSFLLRRKREFQLFINQLGNQVSIQNRISSCCIIDKMHSTADRKNMNIHIFDSSEQCKSLQLKISIPKQYLRRKIHLLIHLSSKNNAVSKLEDQCMYIKCTEGQIWKTFYSFLELLFQKSSQNVIGVQFYTPLFCKYLIAKELSFLLSPSSRFKCVNTKKTSAKIFTSEPCSFSAVVKASTKNSIQPIQLLKQTSTIPNSTLEFQVKQKPSCSMTLKRKSTNFEYVSRAKNLKVGHDFCKKVSCQCHERNKWKIFKQVCKKSPINYTEILEVEGMLDNSELSQILCSQPEKSHSFNSMKAHQNSSTAIDSKEKKYLKFESTQDVELSVKSSHQIVDIPSELDLCRSENISIQTEFKQSRKSIMSIRNQKLSSDKPDEEKVSDSSISQCKTNIFANFNKIINSQDKLEEARKKYCADSTNIFIKDECKEMTVPSKDHNIASEINSNLLPVSSAYFQSVSNKECQSTSEWPVESQNSCVSRVIKPMAGFQPISANQQPMGFLTAAGKSLNVSEKAILAAQKMFDDVCSQEINILEDLAGEAPLSSASVSKKPAYPGENYMENEFNSDLADKFFEEMPFDDKEMESNSKENFVQVTNINIVKPQVGKIRKSLGGRRSLKPYTLQK